MKIQIRNTLSAADFCLLRLAAGWQIPTEEQVKKALSNSLYTVSATDGEKTVGMGRLVGDGVSICYIQDLIVLPEYQGKGIGKLLVKRLLAWVENNALSGTKVTVGLMSAKSKEGFYQTFGFRTRPNEREGAGMVMNLSIGEDKVCV